MTHPERPVRRAAGLVALAACAVILSACSSGTTTAVAATTPTSASPSAPTSTSAASSTRVVPAAAASAPASPAPASAAPVTVSSAVGASPAATSAPSTPAPNAVVSGGSCTDLTAAAASAALGKATTVTLDNSVAASPGLSICDITVAGEVYPVQLSVDTTATPAGFAAEEQAAPNGKPLAGVGDKAFTSSIGVEALQGDADIEVTGPAGPVLGGNYTVPTAIVKAMIAALK